MERDWFIVNHWEDKFCREAYRDLCVHAEFQHLRALALLSPGTTPQVCPVDSLVNTSNKVPSEDSISVKTLAPCSWRYVLSMDDLARLRLKARSDVVVTWEIEATTDVRGEGIDSLDFHADLNALKVILPDESHERPLSSQPVPRSDSPLLQQLKQGETTYAHCAWCATTLPTRYKLEEHYYLAHHVVLQPSCCAPPSVFQTIMGKELQLRHKNFASFGITKLLLRPHMDPEEAREVLGATCSLTEDKVRVWYVKMPDLKQGTVEMPDIISPDLHWLADEEADLNDYLIDPTNPVVCLPAQDNPLYWLIREQCAESRYGEPGSTRNF